jgi:2-amino-4-hydroxy-6-hydroxymethyldihydropteridine diphosphokinase
VVILGLGTNLGNKLHFLRSGLDCLRQLKDVTVREVSPIYISDALLPEGAPPSWNKPYLNCAVRCDTTLTPLAFLKSLKTIEIKLGRKVGEVWAPRPIDIDILAWNDLVEI